jgi:YebC/PmpR family DNA-binding regulatory protein
MYLLYSRSHQSAVHALRAAGSRRFDMLAVQGFSHRARLSRESGRAGSSLPEFFQMSGHSKWATIKHKKAATDAKRGKIFTRLIKEIQIAARSGGDPDGNPRLRTAILAAKNVSMPSDNIKKAIMRGTGELEGGQIDEVMFEGYGPGGAAVLVSVATDNRNRTVSEIRHMFSKNGGNLGEQGSVAWMFDRKSQIVVEKDKMGEDDLMALVLDAGAEDLKDSGDSWEVISDPAMHEKVLEAIQNAKLEPVSAEVAMVPRNLMKLEGKTAQGMLKLSEALEEHDDVQNVYSNFDVDEEEVAALA